MASPSPDIEAFKRGYALHGRGELDGAAAEYARAIELNPRLADALHLLGTITAQRGEPAAGLELIDRAIAVDAETALFWCNRANTLLLLHRPEEAVASALKAIGLQPDQAELHLNLAQAHKAADRHEDAVAACDRAIALAPGHVTPHKVRAECLAHLRRHAEAVAAYERALEIEPMGSALGAYAQLVLDVCDWRRAAAIAPRLDAAIEAGGGGVFPFAYLGYGRSAMAQRRCAEAFVAAECPMLPGPAVPVRGARPRLRLAYLSSDFHAHATSLLMAGLIEAHDRRRFEVVGISYGPDDGSSLRRRMVAAFDRFHDASTMTDRDTAALVRREEIDIAIDVNGLAGKLRLGALASRPAPLQVAFLGYPGTTGAPYIDYVIADRWVAPPEAQPAFSEHIVAMPHSYQVNDRARERAGAPPSRAACGLPPSGFVFCCFNAAFKITPPVFGVWMQLLKSVPGSVLWLIDSHALAIAALRSAAAAAGVEPTRLVLAPKAAPAAHLARHAHADLVLDTLPYNAHTTAADALWAGVPLVTCVGDSFAGRVGASLLDALGLPELITTSLPAYGQLCLQLARDPARLAAMRAKVAANRETAPLFDTARYTRDLETAFTTMWAAHLGGAPPKGFAVPAG